LSSLPEGQSWGQLKWFSVPISQIEFLLQTEIVVVLEGLGLVVVVVDVVVVVVVVVEVVDVVVVVVVVVEVVDEVVIIVDAVVVVLLGRGLGRLRMVVVVVLVVVVTSVTSIETQSDLPSSSHNTLK